MSTRREDMRPNTVYFAQECTNCRQQVYGGQPELIHAYFEDGEIDQHSACPKCADAIKTHNARVEPILAARQEQQQQAAGITPAPVAIPVPVPQPPAAKLPPIEVGLTEALLMLAQGQKDILHQLKGMQHPTLPTPQPEKKITKAKNAKPAGTTRRR